MSLLKKKPPVMSLNQKRTRSKLRRILYWGIILIVLGMLWVAYVLEQIGSIDRNSNVVTTMATPADAGIILGAAMWGDRPSPVLQERLRLSIKDYEAGKFEYFIVTGGLDKPGNRYTEAEGMAIYLEEHGVPRDKILLENYATSTYENLKFSQNIMEEHGLATALVITHTFHGNRAYEIAHALNYSNPKLSLTETNVLPPIPTISREILAYTKWKLDHIAIAFGWK